jgi:hypothetical protein
MQNLRNVHKSFASFLLLLVFGMQVQATFACEMANYSGSIDDCCCGEGHPQEAPPKAVMDMDVMDMDDGEPCCHHDLNLVVKGSDPEHGDAPLTVAKSVELKLSPILLTLFITWLDEPALTTPSLTGDAAGPPPTPGNRTYLTTQRLRI